ncbi:WhiB family transcriptional regulator [Streptomyces sp. CNQ085]|uniref:WhiB family transcriptional regulator n=1 Tax=Streptomyces sp. CNQ085 TaxID=2886944 RepID=UPI001F51314A|nr:WhiB family transcriptional regulator [Streptomyces sp. CNQ085]MCI0386195.1 WhiB family transcriptional regulator [Streptomyces sp. CNQ085]
MSRDWMDHAACRDVDPELFFPDTGGPNKNTEIALSYCARCPVLADCRAYADHMESQRGDRYSSGIWGGTTERERLNARRRAARKRAAA